VKLREQYQLREVRILEAEEVQEDLVAAAQWGAEDLVEAEEAEDKK
jgi:hypothetical protein